MKLLIIICLKWRGSHFHDKNWAPALLYTKLQVRDKYNSDVNLASATPEIILGHELYRYDVAQS